MFFQDLHPWKAYYNPLQIASDSNIHIPSVCTCINPAEISNHCSIPSGYTHSALTGTSSVTLHPLWAAQISSDFKTETSLSCCQACYLHLPPPREEFLCWVHLPSCAHCCHPPLLPSARSKGMRPRWGQLARKRYCQEGPGDSSRWDSNAKQLQKWQLSWDPHQATPTRSTLLLPSGQPSNQNQTAAVLCPLLPNTG